MIRLLDTATLHSIGERIRKWNVVLLNQNTEANAYVRLAPVISELYMIPSQNNFSAGSLRWDDNLIIHENRHMQQFSNFNNGLTKVFSFLFGQEGQLFANGITIPDYFFEGDAVWQETLVSKQGRGRLPYFFNGMKSMALQNKKYSWMKLRSGSLQHYTPDHYELGYQLVAYGYEKYGNDFWRKVTEDAVRFKGLFYSFNKAIERYSGKTYSQFRQDAIQYFREQTISTAAANNYESSYITPSKKNNVVDYLFPQFVNDDTIIVTKQSYKELNSFYFLINGKEKKIRVKDFVIDDYFSYRNGKLVYAAYQSDPRWTNRNYSVIQLLDIYSNEQTQLTFQSTCFSPDINDEGTEVLAVNVNTDGSNYLHRLNAVSGELMQQVPNPNNYFFTQTKYINNDFAVSAVRNPAGEMSLIKVNLANGEAEPLIPFSYNVLGYPFVKNDTAYFAMMDGYGNTGNKSTDRIFAISLKDKKLCRITSNINGVYHPSVNSKGDMVFSAFTADGNRLIKLNGAQVNYTETVNAEKTITNEAPAASALQQRGADVLQQVSTETPAVSKYKKSFRLFNFHSARPFSDDPEYGYTFYSDNILTNFFSTVTYTYNRNEQSHAAAFDLVYAGWFPYLRAGVERSFNRKVRTSRGDLFNYTATKLYAGFNVPLQFINGRTFKYFNFGTSFNREYIPNRIVQGKVQSINLDYLSSFISFTHTARQARQNINPAWRQTLLITYRNAFNKSTANNQVEKNKLVADASLFFPGLFKNHSLVIDGAFQQRDTTRSDFFSKTFSMSRGYQDYNGTEVYKLGVNYNFPLFYPDFGLGNIFFIQRIRANVFYDYTAGKKAPSSREIINRSTGCEIYFDTKLWNALPASLGVRYSRLLDTDTENPTAVNRWEITIPFSIIPD